MWADSHLREEHSSGAQTGRVTVSGDEGREDAERDPILQGQHHCEHRAGTSVAI